VEITRSGGHHSGGAGRFQQSGRHHHCSCPDPESGRLSLNRFHAGGVTPGGDPMA